MAGYPKIHHTEEGMRDGLQIENPDIPVADKIRLIEALSETGLKEIAIGSFVSPKWTPQMAHIDELVIGFKPKAGVRYTYTALNDTGMERALSHTPPLSPRTREISTFISMCDVFAQRNTNKNKAQELERCAKKIEKARADGLKEGAVHISTAFGSNWVGEFSLEQRMFWIDRLVQMWEEAGIPVTHIGFSDAMSWNMPHQVKQQLLAVKERWPAITNFNLHLHNGRGQALASIFAALEALDGTDTLGVQSSIGGMAGCPYCGNGQAAMMIATEDLMHMLQEMGIYTGVDLYKLIEVVWLAEEVVGHRLYGFTSKCGPRPRYDRLYPMDMPRIETLEQAKHFILGPETYKDGQTPWKKPIESYQRSTPGTRGKSSDS
jgi:hydroxymethylglutaryl-CoA lyase